MPYTPKQRHQAVQRALKMNMLFKEPTFDEIMDALNKPWNDPTRKPDFDAALAKTPLVQAEIDWLWNYLQRCTETDTGGWGIPPKNMTNPKWLPEAASVGW